MPLYEYECDACGHRFERIQKYSDPLEDTCPKCGGVVHKLMSSPAIQFKGSGFYITDYAKKDHTDAAKADSAQGGKAEKSEASESSGKSEKSGKTETPAKSEKTPPSTASGQSSSSSSPAAPAGTPSTKN